MIEAFLQYLEAVRRYSPLTVAAYRRDIEAFAAWYGGSLERVQSEDLRDWIMYRTVRKHAPASVNRSLAALGAFFRYLRREGVVPRDVFGPIRSLKVPKRLPAFVPSKQMRAIVEDTAEEASETALPPRDALILLLFYTCGLRLAELVGLNRADVAGDTLRVRGKGDKERLIPLLPAVRVKIEEHLSRQNICISDSKALFLSSYGERISRTAVYRVVRAELQRVQVRGKSSPHVLRHTFATELLNHGADMRAIQELMGHASLASTQIYTHNSIDALKKTYAAAHPHSQNDSKK